VAIPAKRYAVTNRVRPRPVYAVSFQIARPNAPRTALPSFMVAGDIRALTTVSGIINNLPPFVGCKLHYSLLSDIESYICSVCLSSVAKQQFGCVKYVIALT